MIYRLNSCNTITSLALLRQLYNRKTTTSQSARSLRSVRTKSNASLRRSCLLTRSANASQVQIVAQAASQSGEVDYRSVTTASPLLPQRRCQSLGRFPGEVDQDGNPRQQTDEYQQSGMVSCQRPRQFLCVPQVFPSNKSNQRRRKESQSLDVFPSQLRSALSQRSPLASCASHDDMEDEHTRLLDSQEEHNVILTIPNGDQAEQQQLELSRPINGHVKTGGYQAVRLIHNDDEGIDVNSESLSSRTQPASSLTASGDQEKRWHSCEQLHSTSTTGDPKQRARDNKVDTAIASTVNKSVKQWQWLVNLFGVGHAADNFSRSPQTGEEFSDLHRDDRESVV